MNVQITTEQAKAKGFPIFEGGEHEFFDLRGDGLGIFSITLGNGGTITIDVTEDLNEKDETGGKVQVSYESSNGNASLRALALSPDDTQKAHGDSYALYYGKKFPTLEGEYDKETFELDWTSIKGMKILSIRLDNNTGVTCCVIPAFTADKGKSGCIDVKVHGRHGNNHYLQVGSDVIKGDIYSLIYTTDEPSEA